MPELPEVETIRNELVPHVVGHSIVGVDLFWEGVLKEPTPDEFRRRISRQRIVGLSRRGKYLFFHLGGGERIVMHMKMTGSLLIDPSDRRFSRAVIYLDNGKELHFWDPRKFGGMWLARDDRGIGAKLGPEPLEKSFTRQSLEKILQGRKAPIKPVLIDQSLIAGIGNMYADEALYEARIHPLRPAGSLDREEMIRLYRAIRHVLRRGLASKGASVRNYIRPDGTPGHAHDDFRVAHGVGKQCHRCGGAIERIVVRGRGTYFCPRCQPLP